MNFYYEPKMGAQLAAWNYYFCPVTGADEYIWEFDKGAVGDPLIFPTSKFLSNGHEFMSLGTREKEYTQLFSQVNDGLRRWRSRWTSKRSTARARI